MRRSFMIRVRNARAQPAHLVLEPRGPDRIFEPGEVLDVFDLAVDGAGEAVKVVNGEAVRSGGLLEIELDDLGLKLYGWMDALLDFVYEPGPAGVVVPSGPALSCSLTVTNDRLQAARMVLEPGAREVRFEPKEVRAPPEVAPGQVQPRRQNNLRDGLEIEARISGAQRDSSIPVMEFDLDEQGLVIRMNESFCTVEHIGEVEKWRGY